MRVATDVGGTFTDLVYSVEGQLHTAKVDTTPPDFESGVMNTLDKARLDPKAIEFFAHGSTVIINAITERKGVKTALITTKGFRDVLEIARGNRPDLFNFNFRKPRPFVERYLRLELDERVNYKGELSKEVDLGSLTDLLDFLKAEKVEAIAIAFLHAYINPVNEIATAEAIAKLWPEVSVLASHQISREWREYERTNTTVLSAYIHPVAKTYIESLQARLVDRGFEQPPYLMQSNTGISSVKAVLENPTSMIESGPASGIFAAAWLGNEIDINNLLVLDIGGTTAKCTLIENGEIRVSTDYHIEKTNTDPGYPIQTPVSEIVEIGNGGGSIAWVDEGKKLHVGPQSAGAMPGPAAYGKGGTFPTTTDANLLMGRIDKNNFVGGEVEPDLDAVYKAFEPLEKSLNMSREELARGVVRVANSNMTNALRLVSTNKGHDPREFTLIAFGGGGAMHVVALAEELNIPRVIVPANSAVFSALGMLLTDIRRDYVQTKLLRLDTDGIDEIGSLFDGMQQQAKADFEAEKNNNHTDDAEFHYYLDMRYNGQEHTVKVPASISSAGKFDLSEIATTFHSSHEQRYTYTLDTDIEVVNFHLVAIINVDKPTLARKEATGKKMEATFMHSRQVDFDHHGIHETNVYNGMEMEAGMRLQGPAIIQEPSVTLVISPGHNAEVDNFGNYHVLLRGGQS
ncbi:MAG: hydantoinase/oxoprolinase family protein [Gammaproteobacteria bacterium]|nr:hydantoinase/oxoprolinase family protein [Gammaproteobacteria bacterium]